MSNRASRILDILKQFKLPGTFQGVSPFKSGHINETFISQFILEDGTQQQFIHQWINDEVFKDVPGMMRNISIVTDHLRAEKGADPRETLQIVPTISGDLYFLDEEKEYWRTYVFVSGTESFGVCTGPAQAREAARVLGRFQGLLADLEPSQLVETIPYFHHTPRRYGIFEKALEANPRQRVRKVQAEIDFARSRQKDGGRLIEGLEAGWLPKRVTHNDTKLNNVLFDEISGSAVCLVDLDTCMGGTILYDFGDLVRNVSVSAAEDETDLSKVEVSLPQFEALTSGYAESIRDSIAPVEIELLTLAPRIMALTLGVRFLTDYIEGDRYFKIHRPNHNLDRARAQFKIVQSMEANESAMRMIVEREFGSVLS